MRINDGSICAECTHFSHECYDTGCEEYCMNPDRKIVNVFVDDYDYEEVVTNCIGFKELYKPKK